MRGRLHRKEDHSSHYHHHPYHDSSRGRGQGNTNTADRLPAFHHQQQGFMNHGHGSSVLPFSMNNSSAHGAWSYAYPHRNVFRQQRNGSYSWYQENIRPQTNLSSLQENSLSDRLQESRTDMRNQQNYRHQKNYSSVRSQNSSTHDTYTQQHTRQGFTAHPSHNAGPPQSQHRQQSGNNTEIKMTKLPFFEVVATPLKAMIISTEPHGINRLHFAIEKSLLQHLRDRNTTDPYQVQIRICKNDDSSEQKDYFPSDLQMKVNGQLCILPGWNTIPKGPTAPIEITSKCDFVKNFNTIDVRTRDYLVVFIHVTRRLTHEDLVKKLLAKSPIDPSATVAKIKEKLQEDSVNGADITLTSLHFSLMCPVSKARMRLPCRASSCQHLQCFDAAFYLKMNEKKPNWICPVCSNIIEYENLQIDEHFKNILEQNISSNKILLQVDGSWKPFQPKDVNKSILTLDDTIDHPTADDNEFHPADDNEPHPADDSEPHPADGNESHPADDSEPHPADGKEAHAADGKESHAADGKESYAADDESHHITIDLLSEDESSVSNSEDVLPVLIDTDRASCKDTQNHTVTEVVILSDDESHGSPATLPSPSFWGLSRRAASSTPRVRSRRRRMHNAKKTPVTATITTTFTTSTSNTSTCTGNIGDDFIPL